MIEDTMSAISRAEGELDRLQLSGAISPSDWEERRCYLRAAKCLVIDSDPSADGQMEVLEQINEFAANIVVAD